MFSHCAFIYEAGNHHLHLDDEQATKYFVLTTLLLEVENIHVIEEKLQWMLLGIEQDQGNEKLFSQLLPELITLDVDVFTFVIDKEKMLQESGIGTQESMFTYASERIYQTLFAEQTDMFAKIYQQPTAFAEVFQTFVEHQVQPNLFNYSTFAFTESIDQPLMELAKLICDYIFEQFEEKNPTDSHVLKQLSYSHSFYMETFPTIQFRVDAYDEIDTLITNQAIEDAEAYIHTYEKSELRIVQDRVNFLKFLRTQLSIRPNKYIHGQEIIKNIRAFSQEPMSKETLMREIIGPLRDEGILIASTRDGYKLPTSIDDLREYVEFSRSTAMPILRRIEKSREKILEITDGKVDILDEDLF